MAPAWLGAPGNGAAGAEPGAAVLPGLCSEDAAPLALNGLVELAGPALLALMEGLEVVAQPVSHAVTTTRQSDVIFMRRNRENTDQAVGD